MSGTPPLSSTNKRYPLDRLRPHPQNYQAHPPEQLEQIQASLREHGFYRFVVVAEDDVILAGHGVVAAALALGMTHAPILRLPIASSSPAAMRVMVGDNELNNLADVDERGLTELLREIAQQGADALLGTGFDADQLALLTYVTRPAAEIESLDAAAEWVGLPAWEAGEKPYKLIVLFETQNDRERFVKEQDNFSLDQGRDGAQTWSASWPARARRNVKAVKFTEAGSA